MDMPQLEKLLEVRNLTPDNRVLDLAAGTGRIAEFISDQTGVHILGIDVATEAMEYARQRAKEKRQLLDFQFGNIDALDFPPHSFDTVIAIASIHYANEISATISQFKELLTPDGQAAIFSFQYQGDDAPPENLLPENTEMGKALTTHGFSFQSWDYTQSEITVRRR